MTGSQHAETLCDPGGTEVEPISEGFEDDSGVVLEIFCEVDFFLIAIFIPARLFT
jgi:hypothetical protein